MCSKGEGEREQSAVTYEIWKSKDGERTDSHDNSFLQQDLTSDVEIYYAGLYSKAVQMAMNLTVVT